MNRRRLSLAVLVVGAIVTVLLATRTPRDQHLRLVLGDAAPAVTALEVTYLDEGDPARETRLAFEAGRAPRVVALDPSLANGTYVLRIEADTREGRQTVERQVTLSGGTTQVDLSAALPRP